MKIRSYYINLWSIPFAAGICLMASAFWLATKNSSPYDLTEFLIYLVLVSAGVFVLLFIDGLPADENRKRLLKITFVIISTLCLTVILFFNNRYEIAPVWDGYAFVLAAPGICLLSALSFGKVVCKWITHQNIASIAFDFFINHYGSGSLGKKLKDYDNKFIIGSWQEDAFLRRFMQDKHESHYYEGAYNWAISYKNKESWCEAKKFYKEGQYADMAKCLGHTAHLVSDMSSPCHAWNIKHGEYPKFLIMCPFEGFAEKYRDNLKAKIETALNTNIGHTKADIYAILDGLDTIKSGYVTTTSVTHKSKNANDYDLKALFDYAASETKKNRIAKKYFKNGQDKHVEELKELKKDVKEEVKNIHKLAEDSLVKATKEVVAMLLLFESKL